MASEDDTTDEIQQAHNAPLAAEPDDYDGHDSAYGGSIGAHSMISLNESITRYRQENGRTYHAYKDGKYYLPNDEGELDRLDLQHHLFSLTFGEKLCIAPIEGKPLNRVLDLGTGTGIWAIDFADEHPESQVLGVDLSPTQPIFLPPNLRFEIDDIEDNWQYPQKFDFIHSRMLAGAIVDWPRLIGQIFENLNPGGYCQLSDLSVPFRSDDDSAGPNSAVKKWSDKILEASVGFGSLMNSAEKYKEQMIAAGFENVVEVQYKWPLNRWPLDPKMKELGMWTYENIAPNVFGLSLALFTRVLGWTTEELKAFVAEVEKELKDTTVHTYIPIYVVWGQKPQNKGT